MLSDDDREYIKSLFPNAFSTTIEAIPNDIREALNKYFDDIDKAHKNAGNSQLQFN